MICDVCFHHCDLKEGSRGYCQARSCQNGKNISLNYGAVTSIALDPIEKKPLARFYPGSRILSVGSWGCNMRCPWCQNDSISRRAVRSRQTSAGDLIKLAAELRDEGNIGIAYTYNEPLISREFVQETANAAHDSGLLNVLVTNGMADPEILSGMLPVIDALNIDLKTIRPEAYKKIGGDLGTVLANITQSVQCAHVEITTLIVPGFNDKEDEMDELARTLAKIDPEVTLHVTRFYSAGEMRTTPPTPVGTVYHLADIARRHLRYVYTGNC